MNAVNKDLILSQLTPQQKLTVSDETIAEINALAEDPDYGPEFLNTYMDCMNVLKENSNRRQHSHYLEAVKFFSLVEAGHTLTDAYIKVFPSRFDARGHGDKTNMRGEASRYNNTQMVNEIRKVATVPIRLIHRHLLHKAILKQADLMENANSEMVQQKAAECLIRELKDPDDTNINLTVDDGASSAIAAMHQAAKDLAAAQHRAAQSGVPLKDIAESKLTIDGEAKRVDDDE